MSCRHLPYREQHMVLHFDKARESNVMRLNSCSVLQMAISCQNRGLQKEFDLVQYVIGKDMVQRNFEELSHRIDDDPKAT